MPLTFITMTKTRLPLVLCVIAIAGCGTSNSALSSSSTCAQFMHADETERVQIAAALYEHSRGPSSLGATNALLETESTCRDQPTEELGSVPVLSGSDRPPATTSPQTTTPTRSAPDKSGPLNPATNSEGAGSASFAGQIKKYEKLTQRQPSNLSAWEHLAEALLHEAGGEAYVTRTGVTSKGRELFSRAAQAWSSYLALNPPKPSVKLAQLMVSVYGEEGLKQPAQAVQVLQLVVAARPTSAALYAQLAEYAYKAGNVRVGDLASGKAVSLAPAGARVRIKKELEEVKKNPSGEKVYTTTTNGKTYLVKKAANGTYTGTEVTNPG